MADGGVSLHLGRQQVSPALIDEAKKKKKKYKRAHSRGCTHTHTHTHTHPPPQPNHRKGNHLYCYTFSPVDVFFLAALQGIWALGGSAES